MMMVLNTSQLRRFDMPQCEIWRATRRDTLRAEAYAQTLSGKKFAIEVHERAMINLEIRIAKGLYTPTEKDLQELEERRKEKAARDAAETEIKA